MAKKEAVGEGGQEAEVPAGDVQKEQLRRMVKMLFAFFGVGIGLLGMVAFAACLVPARRAMRINPTVALAE